MFWIKCPHYFIYIPIIITKIAFQSAILDNLLFTEIKNKRFLTKSLIYTILLDDFTLAHMIMVLKSSVKSHYFHGMKPVLPHCFLGAFQVSAFQSFYNLLMLFYGTYMLFLAAVVKIFYSHNMIS